MELPYQHAEPKNVLITRDGTGTNETQDEVYIRTDRGLSVRWSQQGPLSVRAPSALSGSLCGLCGNANGLRKDDRTTRHLLPARSVREFAHSWKVDGYRHCAQPGGRAAGRLAFGAIRGADLTACAGIGYTFLKEARKKCSTIRQRAFQVSPPPSAPGPGGWSS